MGRRFWRFITSPPVVVVFVILALAALWYYVGVYLPGQYAQI